MGGASVADAVPAVTTGPAPVMDSTASVAEYAAGPNTTVARRLGSAISASSVAISWSHAMKHATLRPAARANYSSTSPLGNSDTAILSEPSSPMENGTT